MIRNQALRKIDKRIYLVFIALIALTLVNALFSTVTIQRSQNITSDIVYNTNPSVNALSRMNLLVTRSRMMITNWVYLPHGSQDAKELAELNSKEYILLRGTITGLMKHWNDEKESQAMKNVFSDYEELIRYETSITNLLNDFEDFSDPQIKFQTQDILESKIIPLSTKLATQLDKITDSQTKKALRKQDSMLNRFNSLMVMIIGFAILIICAVLFATLILSRSVIVPVLHVKELIMKMGRGELPEMTMRAPDNAVGEMSQALGFMITGFRQTSRFVEEIGKGNFDHPYEPLSNKDVQGHALITMRNRLKDAAEEDARRMWMAEGLAELNQTMRSSNEDFEELLNRIIKVIVSHINVDQAAIFLLNNDNLKEMHIQLGAYHGLNNRILNSKRHELSGGVIGQALLNNQTMLLEHHYDPYFSIEKDGTEVTSGSLMIIPLTTNTKVVGVLTVSNLNKLRSEEKELLQKMAEPIAASLFSVRANLITSQLLEESRKQTEELANQEQRLRKINNELIVQSDKLLISEEELKLQQMELQKVNLMLRDKARLLEEQNMALEVARQSITFKAAQLEESNKYKSAFLANMSHELRTPLNSILILARLLSDNKNKHLTEREIEHAQVIHKSGTDLLTLINDILDLSKIEAGKLEMIYEKFSLQDFTKQMQLLFREVAAENKIEFNCDCPNTDIILFSDQARLAQITKNLLSNAFKFTPEGGKVCMTYSIAGNDILFRSKKLLQSSQVARICIKDTGIGIPEEKQQLIFEAFQQADGSTSRKFGGTGLGLSITQELVTLMGGEIHLNSNENEGSIFSVFLPIDNVEEDEIKNNIIVSGKEKKYSLLDDREKISKGDGSILIIEDDYVFAKMLMDQCHRYDCKALIALEGDWGLKYAKEYQPRCIILDLRLPRMDGWEVLKQLKADPACAHIPVHIITAVDKMMLGLEMGANSYLQKPIDQKAMDDLFHRMLQTKSSKKYYYAGSDINELENLQKALKTTEPGAEIEVMNDAEWENMSANTACILIGSNSTYAEIEVLEKQGDALHIPLVYVKNEPDQCLIAASSIERKHASVVSKTTNEILRGKIVLLADDDMRNIYSITNILEDEGMEVISAFDGADALEKLHNNKDIHIVLMDIMMPNMNGLEAIAAIREKPEWEKLPVIAVTAKAMNSDREICLQAGASDYLTKPINVEQLTSVLKVWLHK
jgi:signal transduction histidine kinase/DNA-binding response OmpR family regulator